MEEMSKKNKHKTTKNKTHKKHKNTKKHKPFSIIVIFYP